MGKEGRKCSSNDEGSWYKYTYTSDLAVGIYCLFEPHSIPVCIQVQLLGNYQTKNS